MTGDIINSLTSVGQSVGMTRADGGEEGLRVNASLEFG